VRVAGDIAPNVHGYDRGLATLAGHTSVTAEPCYFTGAGTARLADFTSFGQSLLVGAGDSAKRSSFQLGAIATASLANDSNWFSANHSIADGGCGFPCLKTPEARLECRAS